MSTAYLLDFYTGAPYVGDAAQTAASSGATYPAVAVEIAFTSAPGAEAPAWVDVTPFLKSASVRRGRQRELDQFQAGSASIVLDNRDRRFDPEHATGPHFGNLLPLKRVRMLATHGGVTYPVFDHFIDAIVQSYDIPGNATAIVSTTDAFKVLALTALSPSPYETEVRFDGPKFWWHLDNSSGALTTTDEIGGVVLTAVGTGVFGATGLKKESSATAWSSVTDDTSGIRNTAFTNGLNIPANGDFTMECLIGSATLPPSVPFQIVDLRRSNNTNTAFQITTSGFASGFHNSGPITGTTNITGAASHHLALVRRSSTLFLYVDGAIEGTSFGSTSALAPGQVHIGNAPALTVGFHGTIDEVALYDKALSGARLAAHAAARTSGAGWGQELSGARLNRILTLAGFPLADRAIDAGDTTLRTSSLGTSTLAHAQKVAETELGTLFTTRDGKVRFISRNNLSNAFYAASQATFGDAGAELGYRDLALGLDEQELINQVRAQNFGGIEQVFRDATSVATFFLRERSRSSLLAATDAETLQRAQYEVELHKNVTTRLDSISLAPAGNPTTHWAQALGRELADKITVVRRPQAVGSAISVDLRIEGISHEIGPKRWITTWAMSPAAIGQIWTLDVDGAMELDSTTILGF